MALREEEEEHINHERWLISYADMITLLMVLFVVMFAISQVDLKKFDELKTGVAAGFGQSSSPFQGSSGTMAERSEPMEPAAPVLVNNAQQVDGDADGAFQPDPEDQSRAAAREAEATAEVERLSEAERRVREALRARGLEGDVRTTIDSRGLRLSMISQHVVFTSDSATLTRRGARVVDTLAPVLRDLPDPVEVAGHTNQVGSKPASYDSDWDLSAARAVTVLRRLSEEDGIPSRRLTALAHGSVQPLIPPSDPRAARINKRVDLTIVSSAPEETRALFTQVLAQQKEEDR